MLAHLKRASGDVGKLRQAAWVAFSCIDMWVSWVVLSCSSCVNCIVLRDWHWDTTVKRIYNCSNAPCHSIQKCYSQLSPCKLFQCTAVGWWQRRRRSRWRRWTLPAPSAVLQAKPEPGIMMICWYSDMLICSSWWMLIYWYADDVYGEDISLLAIFCTLSTSPILHSLEFYSPSCLFQICTVLIKDMWRYAGDQSSLKGNIQLVLSRKLSFWKHNLRGNAWTTSTSTLIST